MHFSVQSRSIFAALALLTGGCNSAPQTDAKGVNAQGSADPSQIVGESGLSLRDYMVHLVNYNAGQLWKWQSTVSDEKGERQTIPQSDDEWEEAESAALTLRELMRPLGAVNKGNSGWTSKMADLEKAIDEAAAHAEKKDGAAFLAAGVKIDNACVECHYSFAPHLELPRPIPEPES